LRGIGILNPKDKILQKKKKTLNKPHDEEGEVKCMEKPDKFKC
jgi:hypothetical protein